MNVTGIDSDGIAHIVEMSADERIISDFYQYLREERGMTREAAIGWLGDLGGGSRLESLLTPQLLAYCDDEPQPKYHTNGTICTTPYGAEGTGPDGCLCPKSSALCAKGTWTLADSIADIERVQRMDAVR